MTPKWTLEPMDPDDFRTCGESRTSSGKVKCEYHPDHHPGDHHFGRGQTGRWYSWPK